MAKAKSHSHSNRGRDASDIAKSRRVFRVQPDLPLDYPQPVRSVTRVKPTQLNLFEIEDRRTYHPKAEKRAARSFTRAQHQLVVAPSTPKVAYPSAQVAFQAPDNVLVCVRRQRRKEVLHALQKAGKRGQKRPRRSYYSSIKC